ncbi:transposase [Rhodococcus fascians]|nr:transposase [Rhodococcus fascians]MBY4061033.1 transposase [Rhodococcus fascians]MBY4071163.1 transposase [Rhodococcus fascians]
MVIAETARVRRDLTTITTPDDVVAELGLLTAYRADLMGEWVSRINRLRALLLRIFPELERAFDYTTRTGLALPTRYRTPAAAEHQRHVHATIALARRLVDVLWALLRDQREWRPSGPLAVASVAS